MHKARQIKSSYSSNFVFTYILLFFYLVLTSTTQHIGKQVGKCCILERNNRTGICKLISDCPSELNVFKTGESLTNCGYIDQIEVVCCQTDEEGLFDEPEAEFKESSISSQMCRKYQNAIKVVRYPVTLPGEKPRKIVEEVCTQKLYTLILGGVSAQIKEFPHMALIGTRNRKTKVYQRTLCGGTLISPMYVLTAAHCYNETLLLDKNIDEEYVVRLGVTDFADASEDANQEDFKIDNFTVHADYDFLNLQNDIALIELGRCVEMNPYKRPACLPTQVEDNHYNDLIATGWGQTTHASFSYSQRLKKVRLVKKSCEDNFETRRSINNNVQFCAGSEYANLTRDTCQGDSGGPLQIHNELPNITCMYTIIGITSFGPPACGSTAVYTRIFPFVDWIEKIVWRTV